MVAKYTAAKRYLGVRFWYVHSPLMVPRFLVYVYVGYDKDRGLHYFSDYKNPNKLITCHYKHLQSGTILRPFCINRERIEEALKDATVSVCV